MATSIYDREININESHRVLRWSALFAGLFVALAAQILLMTIGAALGLTATAVGGPGDVSTGLGIGAGIWMILSPIVALFLGGMAAGWVARPATRRAGGFHGVVVWCLATVFGAYLFSTIATFTLGSMAGAAGTAVGAAGQATSGGAVSQQEIEQQIEQQRQQLGQNQQQLEQAGETAAEVGTGIAWVAVFSMVLSCIAAAIGGMTGYRTAFDEDTERRLLDQGVRPEEPMHPTDLH